MCVFVLSCVHRSHLACMCGASEVWCEGETNVIFPKAMAGCTQSQLFVSVLGRYFAALITIIMIKVIIQLSIKM